ncbi:hypothetical protein HMPREF0591_6391 [Mycobacterium parascrofulaceum ATCC BAA-614]|uniref:Core-binding (CB) domain-containing protein n=1 Tax=Mycobacterium parascrofulaceum ATCC BAA-614 TaxID=525368 RepID=D5PJP7_9MYCO|nr:hypothetical protein HMPREF0591_6391 [Mycobacterium parascrofulaceum ATCC BAA-614]
MYQFLDWCEANGHTPALDRDLVRAFVAHLLAKGVPPSTARSRQLGVQRFSAWCEEEAEIDSDPLVKLRAPSWTARSPSPSPTTSCASSSRRAPDATFSTAATKQSSG